MNDITQEQELLEELLEHCTPYAGHWERYHAALEKLRAALAQPAKPVAVQPDCRTCTHRYVSEGRDRCLPDCTNGDKYQESPAVVLWRTE